MATRIRLRRVGRKKIPLYRIVVAERTDPRDGRFIEVLGTYDPKAKTGEKMTVDADKAKAWIAKGATPSETVEALLQAGRGHRARLTTPAERRLVVARFRKPHGLKGDCSIFPLTDQPDQVFAPGRSVWVVDLAGEVVAGPLEISRSRGLSPGVAAGLSRAAAPGKTWKAGTVSFLAAGRGSSSLPPAEGEVYLDELPGFAVLDGRQASRAGHRWYELPAGLTLEVQGAEAGIPASVPEGADSPGRSRGASPGGGIARRARGRRLIREPRCW